MLAKKVGFDPAVMASPFITTIVDACSLLIYFQVAKKIRKDLPMLILSGKDDPVGNFGKDIYLIEKLYKKSGLTKVNIKLYNKTNHDDKIG